MAHCTMPHANKKNKKLVRKFDRLILEYKSLNSNHEELTADAAEGHADFVYMISQFQNRVDNHQKSNYRKSILGIDDKQLLDKRLPHDNNTQDESDEVASNSAPKKNSSSWQKKLLRSIVIKTHPDKLLYFPDDDRMFYTEVCRVAMEAYEKDEDVKLMLAGSEVRIRPRDIRKLHIELIEKDVGLLNVQIHEIKKTHGYIWYLMSDTDKEVFLTNYLSQLGYTVNSNEVKEVMKSKKPPQRKRGEKPVNALKAKRVKKKK